MSAAPEPESVLFIRESSRNLLKLSRRHHRVDETDALRLLPSASVSPERVSSIANKLKSKAVVSAEELCWLKQALLAGPAHAGAVLGAPGALRGLVRELSGRDARRQREAAACCANLPLGGEPRAALAVARAAGPYLLTGAASLSDQLAVLCMWSVGNLSACGGARASRVLRDQGALANLAGAAVRGSGDTLDAALYALSHLVQQLRDELSVDQVQGVLRAVCGVRGGAALLHALSCHPHYPHLQEARDPHYLHQLLASLLHSLRTHLDCTKKDFCCDLIYSVRTLANTCTEQSTCDVVLTYLSENNLSFEFKIVLKSGPSEHLEASLMWLLGNLLNFSSPSVSKEMFFNDVVSEK